jgi:hypothetical protein
MGDTKATNHCQKLHDKFTPMTSDPGGWKNITTLHACFSNRLTLFTFASFD